MKIAGETLLSFLFFKLSYSNTPSNYWRVCSLFLTFFNLLNFNAMSYVIINGCVINATDAVNWDFR